MVHIHRRSPSWSEMIEGRSLSGDVHARIALKVHLADVHEHVDVSKPSERFDHTEVECSKIVGVYENEM